MLNGEHIILKIQHLKQEVERKCGRRVLGSSDCLLLSNNVYDTTGTRLSFNTLRRCFEVMQSVSHPSLHTLDTLAKYCGYNSFGDYCAEENPNISSKQNFDNDPFLNYAVLLFENIKMMSLKDLTYLQLVHQTIKYLDGRKFLIDQFQKRIAKTLNGQVFYFEYAIHVDKLNAYYGSGLNYYLLEKKTKEGQIFGLSLLCFKSWLTQNSEGIKEYFLPIKIHIPDPSTDPAIWGRFFAAHLFYYTDNNIPKTNLLKTIRQYYESINTKTESFGCTTCFEHILSEALLLTRHYEETLFYLNRIKEKGYSHEIGCINLYVNDTLYLLEATALAGLGKFKKSKETFSKINPDNFFFLSQQYSMILYYNLKITFNKGKNIIKQRDSLIEQTGFRKLKEHNLFYDLDYDRRPLKYMGKNGHK